MRIAIAGWLHESNSFAPGVTGLESFSLQRGGDLIDQWAPSRHELSGMLRGIEEEGAECVPLLSATAVPGPVVSAAAWDRIATELLESLDGRQFDGMLLALHGAMTAEQHPDADGELLARLQPRLGPAVPLVVTLDFHANVSDRMAAHAAAILPYQTNPHVDQQEVGRRAAQLLAHLLRKGERCVTSVARPPMLWNILHQNSSCPPLRTPLQQARELERNPSLVSAGILAGYPYADVEEAGPCAIASSTESAEAAAEAAAGLAGSLWAARSELQIDLPGAEQAVCRAVESGRHPVILVDMGDNIGGGSPGDGTLLLRELLRQQAEGWCVVLHDPAGVALCRRAGLGGEAAAEFGGRGDPAQGGPVRVSGRVEQLYSGLWREPEVRHGGLSEWDQGESAVLRTERDGILLLTSRRTPPMSLGQLTSAGIDPSRRRIITVKAAIAFRAAYEPLGGEIIEVDTPGCTAVNPLHFQYRRLRRPIWPLDPAAG